MHTPPVKVKNWNGKDLHGSWLVTMKVDGVRALKKHSGIVSRKSKPLYNLDKVKHLITDAEIFCGTLEDTVSKVRASTQDRPVLKHEVYSLAPLDKRLYMGFVDDPTAAYIRELLKKVLDKGGEGLVLRQGDKWLKVVGKRTYDVKVTALMPGKKKNLGKLGAFMTARGKVSGFTDKQRVEFNTPKMIGVLIEASCKHLTKNGKFRHGNFVRIRWDKPGGKDYGG